MNKNDDEGLLEVLTEIRNWIRVAAHEPAKKLLQAALPDAKTRAAYQMLDGKATIEQVRVACKMSPNVLIALANRCESLGLMGVNIDKKRVRLFDLEDFGLMGDEDLTKSGAK